MPTSDLALNMAASGIVGSSCVGLLNPLDTVRIRFQSSTTTLPGGIRAFARNIILKEGVWRGLWLPGLGANMTAICLSTGFRLGMYPTIRDQITSSFGQTEKNALIMWLSGLIPGFFSYGAITPLYLVKTHMQVSAAPGRPLIYKNTLHGLYTIGKQGGLKQLYRGAPSLMGRGAMLSSGQTLGYDMTKTTLKKQQSDERWPHASRLGVRVVSGRGNILWDAVRLSLYSLHHVKGAVPQFMGLLSNFGARRWCLPILQRKHRVL